MAEQHTFLQAVAYLYARWSLHLGTVPFRVGSPFLNVTYMASPSDPFLICHGNETASP